MSIISRITTWSIGQVLKAADLNGEFSNITNLLNNLDAATTTWTNVKVATLNVTTKATVPNGAASTDAAAFGQIKYLSTPAQSVTTTQTSTTSGTYVSTNSTASITPSSASSRVKITVWGSFSVGGTGTAAQISLFRGSTDLATDTGNGMLKVTTPANAAMRVPTHITFIDSPASASSTTYTAKILSTDASTTVIWAPTNGGQATMILEEIV